MKIFTPEKMVKYGEICLFGENVRPKDVREIQQHNGVLPSLLREKIGQDATLVKQENAREPIYFRDRILYIPQFSGFQRAWRYVRRTQTFLSASGEDISFSIHDRNDDPRQTNIWYDNYAYDFVTGLFVPEERHERFRVFSENIDDITTILFGNLGAFATQAKVIERGRSEYLDAQLLEVGKERALNIGYVYADQAGIIIDKLLREYEALARKKHTCLNINIRMMGRVGGLEGSMQRNELVEPTGIIDEIDFGQRKNAVYPMHNVLASKANGGHVFNVRSVVDETYEALHSAHDKGCVCVEMETREAVESINKGRRRYQNNLFIDFGFIGYISDLPLKGDTLADEDVGIEEGAKNAAKKIIENISH